MLNNPKIRQNLWDNRQSTAAGDAKVLKFMPFHTQVSENSIADAMNRALAIDYIDITRMMRRHGNQFQAKGSQVEAWIQQPPHAMWTYEKGQVLIAQLGESTKPDEDQYYTALLTFQACIEDSKKQDAQSNRTNLFGTLLRRLFGSRRIQVMSFQFFSEKAGMTRVQLQFGGTESRFLHHTRQMNCFLYVGKTYEFQFEDLRSDYRQSLPTAKLNYEHVLETVLLVDMRLCAFRLWVVDVDNDMRLWVADLYSGLPALPAPGQSAKEGVSNVPVRKEEITLSMDEDLNLLALPDCVERNIFLRAVHIGKTWARRHGMLLILGSVPYEVIDTQENRMWAREALTSLGKPVVNICDENHKRAFENLLRSDGAIIVDARSGIIEAVTCQLEVRFGCPYKLGGQGTKHNSALILTYFYDCVAVVGSEAGTLTLFSHQLTKQGRCVRIHS